MRILLDTHLLIWAIANTPRLSDETRSLILDPGNDIHYSAASIWEIAIKARLGRVGFVFEPEKILLSAEASGWRELPVRAADTLLVRHLPSHHSDPFDRLLVAQTIAAGAVLLTADAALPPYSPLVRLV